ncbi:hypothetical protein LSH36_13g25068 [Paralvinella palmiformis]|uniref:Sulfatase N-terminal domain-containing protein n=1 Tax=Paralvinella palmiformis TaxID=53620 RepID=A0AAD9NHZ4_9ANNE|nr:hypothetical protein LSH36_13g25068 [Paralvinella palmiformis]
MATNTSPSYLTTFIAIGCITTIVILLINVQLESYVRTESEVNVNLGQRRDEGQVRRGLRNVLFLIVDDLRPQLGPYIDKDDPEYFGSVTIRTPNLDRLAARSVVFKRAYCQQSLCGPSRASMLTSRRPDMTRAFSNKRYWRKTGGNFTTLPQHFKNNGYWTVGFSKVFHPKESSNNDDPISWSEPYYQPPFSDSHYLMDQSGAGWAMVSDQDRSVAPLADDLTVKHAKLALERAAGETKNGGRPFFVAVGLRKPHLSLVCPEKYYNWYPLEGDNYMRNSSWENPMVKKMAHVGNTVVENGKTVIPSSVLRHLRRAYFACISYMDANIGEIIDKLTRLQLDNDTIVIFVADHGYHLGENRHWGKMTSDEMSTRIPLMIHVPGLTTSGSVTESLVEAVDVFPTLVEAAGLDPIPTCPINCSDVALCTQGTSLLPLFDEPDLQLKEAAFSQVTALDHSRYTIRTDRFRYVEGVKGKKWQLPDQRFKFTPEWDDIGQTWEFYDHRNDSLEQYNLAANPEYHKEIGRLRGLLRQYVERLWEEPKLI